MLVPWITRPCETATKGTGFTTTYNHDANNHLIGGYSYGANGNLTSLPGLTLTYDIENRLTQAVHTTNGTEQYVYNPWNERVWQKTANGGETVYVYGPDGRLAAAQGINIDSFGVMRLMPPQEELRLAGRLLRSDELHGEVMEDPVGTAKAKDYYPYGELKSGARASQFATYRRGESGLDYAINRYYASQVGRFTTPDPYMASGGAANPQSWNRYAYVENDAVNNYDPEGLYTVKPCGGLDPSCNPLQSILIAHYLRSINSMGQYANAYSMVMPLLMAQQHQPRPSPMTVRNLSKEGKNQVFIENTFRWIQVALSFDADCAKWLQGAGTYIDGLLNQNLVAHGVFQNKRTVAAFTGNKGSNVPAGYAAMTINDQGAFFQKGFTLANGSIDSDTDLARVFILLHELGHGVELKDFESDYGDRAAGARNDSKVLQNCQKTLDRLR